MCCGGTPCPCRILRLVLCPAAGRGSEERTAFKACVSHPSLSSAFGRCPTPWMLASHWTQESLVGDVSQNHTDALNTPLPAWLPPYIFVLFVCFSFQGKVRFLKEDICDRHASLRVEIETPTQIRVVLCPGLGSHALSESQL